MTAFEHEPHPAFFPVPPQHTPVSTAGTTHNTRWHAPRGHSSRGHSSRCDSPWGHSPRCDPARCRRHACRRLSLQQGPSQSAQHVHSYMHTVRAQQMQPAQRLCKTIPILKFRPDSLHCYTLSVGKACLWPSSSNLGPVALEQHSGGPAARAGTQSGAGGAMLVCCCAAAQNPGQPGAEPRICQTTLHSALGTAGCDQSPSRG